MARHGDRRSGDRERNGEREGGGEVHSYTERDARVLHQYATSTTNAQPKADGLARPPAHLAAAGDDAPLPYERLAPPAQSLLGEVHHAVPGALRVRDGTPPQETLADGRSVHAHALVLGLRVLGGRKKGQGVSCVCGCFSNADWTVTADGID